MAPTSDERREVAERLRAYPLESVKADHKGEDPLQLPADVMYDLMCIAGVGEDFDSLLHSLADLIDPTCHVVGTISQDWSNGSTVYVHELSCGHTCYTSLSEPPAYCNECGARVVES